METDTTIRITRRQVGKIVQLSPGTVHKVQVKTQYSAHLLEVSDVHFHHDSAVFLPTYDEQTESDGSSDAGKKKPTSFEVIGACYLHAREHPDQSALVVGHTDRSGDPGYNLELSRLRARNVLFVIQGKREEWVKVTLQKNQVEDYQEILIWLSRKRGWNCDPGGKTNKHDSATRAAVRSFQEQYNQRFSGDIPVTGGVGEETWGAFFDVYMAELMNALGANGDGLREARAATRFLPCEAIGCGEDCPITEDRKENYESPVDRRVEILFFDPGEEPETDCSAPKGACAELYNKKMYRFEPVPIKPGLPGLPVTLQLLYKDPEGIDRPFPQGMPVTVAYPDGTPQDLLLAANGALGFSALREKQSFTLRFRFADVAYVASPPPATGGPDVLIGEDDLRSYHEKGYRCFMLPKDFRLAESDWTITGASNYDPAAHEFNNLDDASVTAIGSGGAPVKAVLNPHWLYVRFDYFDRVLKTDTQLAPPPLVLDGFLLDAALSQAPDTRSNWTAGTDGVQCLPWIIQTTPKPDKDVLLRFRTARGTYIDSSGGDATGRRLVTLDTIKREPETEASINQGAPVSFDHLAPSAGRLAYYDLPEVWKSRAYFARIGWDSPPAHQGLFEDLVTNTTTLSQPMRFSLDDLVLCKADAGGHRVTPIRWDAAKDRLAVFCNTFSQNTAAGVADKDNLNPYGLYKADDDAHASYLSQATLTPARADKLAYVVDYPNWPRLVVADGNMFEAFDWRTPDSATGVVGARAAVNWVDATAAPNFVPPENGVPGADGFMEPRPPATKRPFFVISPMRELRSLGTFHNIPPTEVGIGRFDLVLLRCCDVDGVVEVAVSLNYFRFSFNFKAVKDDPRATLAGQKALINEMIRSVPLRWNGRDPEVGTYGPQPSGDPSIVTNPGRAIAQPRNPPQNLRVQILWFAQAFETAKRAHFDLKVKAKVRAFMVPQIGTGEMTFSEFGPLIVGEDNRLPGFFAAAHESGHGGGLNDEYVELVNGASYGADAVYSYQEGGAYKFDNPSMMCYRVQMVTARHFWHVAEWLFWNTNLDFDILHSGFTYRLPHHPKIVPINPKRPPAYTYIDSPVRKKSFKSTKDHAACDLFVHALGSEAYSEQRLLPGRPAVDGVLNVLVKMRFTLHTKKFAEIRKLLGQVDATIKNAFGANGFVVKGVLDAGTPSEYRFNRCLLVFQPRYLVDTFSGDKHYAEAMGIANTAAAYQARVNQVAGNHPVPFHVTTKAKGGSKWTSTRSLQFDASNTSDFSQFFAEMVGLDPAKLAVPASYLTLVQQVIPGATAADISPA